MTQKQSKAMGEKRIKELEAQIADLKKRWPAHSVLPALLMQLDELEEELEQARKSQASSKKEEISCHLGMIN